MDSILNSIKKLLGVSPEDLNFDDEIIIDINTCLSFLNQFGVGPKEGFSITDSSDIWADLLLDRKDLAMAKSYVHIRTQLLFDPPQNSFLVQLLNDQKMKLNGD